MFADREDGKKTPEPEKLYRVVGVTGKYAALWAANSSVARSRFDAEFFPGEQVAKTELI